MATEGDFLAALGEDPADDVTRLVFADWLAERDDPREAWVRHPGLARWSLPDLVDPYRKMLAPDHLPGEGSAALVALGQDAVPAILVELAELAQSQRDPRRDALFGVLQQIVESDEMLRTLDRKLTLDWESKEPIPWGQMLLAGQELKHLGPAAAALVPRLWGLAYYQERPELVAVGLELFDRLGPAAPAAFWYVWESCMDLNGNDDFCRSFFAAIGRQPAHPLTLRILSGALAWEEPSPDAGAAFRTLGRGAITSLVAGPAAGRDHSQFGTWLAALREYGPEVEPLVFSALEQEFARWGIALTASPTWQRLTTEDTPAVVADRPPGVSRRVLAALGAALHAEPILTEAGLAALSAVQYDFGPADVAPLRRLLFSPDPYCRFRAVEALGSVGPAAAEALPDLREVLRERVGRDGVARAVARIRSGDEAAEMLRPYLDPEAAPSEVGGTFHALGFLGAEGLRFLPEVIAYCRRHPNPGGWCEARSLARGWCNNYPEVLRQLLALLRADEGETVRVAVSILTHWSEVPEGARPSLAALRDHPSQAIRDAVRKALGEAGA